MKSSGFRAPDTRRILLICLSFASIAAAIWFLVLEHVRSEQAIAIAVASRDNENMAIALEQYVSRVLEAQDLAAMHVAERFKNIPTAAPSKPLPLPLADPIASNPLFRAVLVTDRLGNVRYTNLPDAPPLNVSSRPAFKFLSSAERSGPVISRPGISPINGDALYSLSRAIRRPDGSFGGTVIVQMKVARLTAFNERARTGPAAVLGVVRSDGVVLARRAGTSVTFGEALRNAPVMRQQRLAGAGNYRTNGHLDGVRRLYSHRRLSEYPVFVFTGVEEAEALRSVTRNRDWYYGAASLLTLALFALAYLVAAGFRRKVLAARSLSEANERLRMAQRRGQIGDWTYDVATETVTWSEPLCEMYGRSPYDALMRLDEVLAYYGEGDSRRFRDALFGVTSSAEPEYVECVSLADSRSPSARRILLWPLKNERGDVTAVAGIDQDISRERLNERLRDEMAHSARIESMNLMASTIAHELAQPLTAAGNYLSVARRYIECLGPDDMAAQARGMLQETVKQLDVVRQIVRRAREMLARRDFEGEHSHVLPIIDDAIALMRAAGSLSDVEIGQSEIDPGLTVLASKVQTQQVVMNLLRNSVQALAGLPSPRVVIGARAMGAIVMFCVEDNGPGVSEELDETFLPFAPSQSGGLGMGLSISRSIVASYGGTMWVDRSFQHGSRICFTLPGQTD